MDYIKTLYATTSSSSLESTNTPVKSLYKNQNSTSKSTPTTSRTPTATPKRLPRPQLPTFDGISSVASSNANDGENTQLPQSSILDVSNEEVESDVMPAKKLKSRELHKKNREARIEKRSQLRNECKCALKCRDLISSDTRLEFNRQYWSQDYVGQQAFIKQYVRQLPIKRRRSRTNEMPTRNRNFSYSVKSDNNEVIKVCGKFFLNTLGYDGSSK